MRFVVKKEIFEELPSACFGVVMAKGIDNNNAYPEIEQFLDESIQAAMQRFEGRKVKEDPDILPYLSTCRSPMQMFASVLRAHNETKKDGVCYKHVAVMPCTAKKFEAQREEFRKNGLPNVDYVITTQELIQMIKESGILFSDIEPDGLDMPFALKSGGGVILA